MNCAQLKGKLVSADRWPGPLRPIELDHLLACESCGEEWVAASLIHDAGWAATPGGPRGDACPDDETLVAVAVDAGSPPTEVVDHLGSCSRCLAELLGLVRDAERLKQVPLRTAPASLERRAVNRGRPVAARPRWRWWPTTLAAAAGLALMAVGAAIVLSDGSPKREAGPGVETLRGADDPAPLPVSPRGGVASAAGLVFSWTPAPGRPRSASTDDPLERPRYRLIVIELDSGTTVVEARTDQTSYTLAPEESARLRRGAGYHWIVEPLGGAGAASAATAFRLEP